MPRLTRILWTLLATLLLAPSLWAAPAEEPVPADVSLFLFHKDVPLGRARVQVDGQPRGTTNANGAAWLLVGAGEHTLTIDKPGFAPTTLRINAHAGGNMRIIVTLSKGGGAPQMDIERSRGSGTGVMAQSGGGEPAEPGTLEGRVVHAETGKPVAGAQVFVSGTPVDTQTNREGRFSAEIPAGEYSLSVIKDGFSTQTVDGVAITAHETTTEQVTLTPAGLELGSFTVTAPYIEGSVASAISEQRESSEVSEVLGAEQMSRSGDSDAADALARVTGLTIEDGKYVVIRGQPARYTKTLWNGSPLPSPDPIKRIIPLDLFPTGVLSSIEVQKAYSVDKPGSFGSGLVGLNTKGVPEEGFAKASISAGGNTQTTGQEGLTFEGGDEILGSDDGKLGLPSEAKHATNNGERSISSLPPSKQEEVGRSFPVIYQAEDQTLPPNSGVSLAAGAEYPIFGGGRAGFLASTKWSRSYTYKEVTQRKFNVRSDGSLDIRDDQVERRTDLDLNLGGYLALGAKWDQHQIASNTFAVRKTKKRTQLTTGTRTLSDDLVIRDYLLEWNQRELTAEQLTGEHEFFGLGLDWQVLWAKANRDLPDRRSYLYAHDLLSEDFYLTEGGVERRYNETEDDISSYDLSLEIPLLQQERLEAKAKTGIYRYSQDRESKTQVYLFEPTATSDTSDLNPENIFARDEIGDSVDFLSVTGPNNQYSGEAKVQARFIKLKVKVPKWLRVSGGLRQESADFSVETFGGTDAERITGGFEETRTLPAVNVTGFLTEKLQLRGAYSQTVSRPILNELSPITFFDPDTGDKFTGNEDLRSAVIDSRELRLEWYPSSNEAFTLGWFQKDYEDPIERALQRLGGSDFVTTVQNARSATVTGTEGSFRFGLGWLGGEGSLMENFYISGNGAVLDSQVTLADAQALNRAERPLEGQAEYVANLQVGYDGQAHDLTVSFNRSGKRLYRAGVASQPPVYRQPVNRLDANWQWKFAEGWAVELTGQNLLNPEVEYLQGERIYRLYQEGISVGAKLGWEFL
jgi:outer membrane receptor protein involved in Fe transport